MTTKYIDRSGRELSSAELERMTRGAEMVPHHLRATPNHGTLTRGVNDLRPTKEELEVAQRMNIPVEKLVAARRREP